MKLPWNRIALGIALALMLTGVAAAQDDQEALLKFIVIRDYNGKPIRNAAVVMHPVNNKGKQEKGGLELKSDEDGRTSFDGVPYGKLRIQVLARGFQTFGQDYDINQPEMEITVKLKRPQGQFSIYSDHPAEEKKNDPPPPPPNNQ